MLVNAAYFGNMLSAIEDADETENIFVRYWALYGIGRALERDRMTTYIANEADGNDFTFELNKLDEMINMLELNLLDAHRRVCEAHGTV